MRYIYLDAKWYQQWRHLNNYTREGHLRHASIYLIKGIVSPTRFLPCTQMYNCFVVHIFTFVVHIFISLQLLVVTQDFIAFEIRRSCLKENIIIPIQRLWLLAVTDEATCEGESWPSILCHLCHKMSTYRHDPTRVPSIPLAILIISFISEEVKIATYIHTVPSKQLDANNLLHPFFQPKFPTTDLQFTSQCGFTAKSYIATLLCVVAGPHAAQASLKFIM